MEDFSSPVAVHQPLKNGGLFHGYDDLEKWWPNQMADPKMILLDQEQRRWGRDHLHKDTYIAFNVCEPLALLLLLWVMFIYNQKW